MSEVILFCRGVMVNHDYCAPCLPKLDSLSRTIPRESVPNVRSLNTVYGHHALLVAAHVRDGSAKLTHTPVARRVPVLSQIIRYLLPVTCLITTLAFLSCSADTVSTEIPTSSPTTESTTSDSIPTSTSMLTPTPAPTPTPTPTLIPSPTPTPAPAGEDYPDWFVDPFIDSCVNAGAPRDGCICGIEWLQDNVSFEDFMTYGPMSEQGQAWREESYKVCRNESN